MISKSEIIADFYLKRSIYYSVYAYFKSVAIEHNTVIIYEKEGNIKPRSILDTKLNIYSLYLPLFSLKRIPIYLHSNLFYLSYYFYLSLS